MGRADPDNLDFVLLAELSAFLHNPIHDFDESVSVDLGFPILDIDSATFTKTIDLPPLNPVATLTLNWPHSRGESTLETNGAPSDADTLHSDGTSVDIVNLDVDVIALALAVLGISPNPLDLGFVDLLSLDVNGGVDVAQHFDLNSVLKDQDASIMLEDGTLLPFAFGSPLPSFQTRQVTMPTMTARSASLCTSHGCDAAQRDRSRLPRRRRPQGA